MKGDQIVNDSARTRSQKKQNPDQWTEVPLLVKIFKILVSELSDHIENALASAIDEEESEDEWEDENEMNSEMRPKKNGGTELSRILGNYENDEEDEDEEDDDEEDEDEEDEEDEEEEDSESEVGEERVPTPKNCKEDEDLDTDQETDRLLGQQYNDDNGYYDQKVSPRSSLGKVVSRLQ